MRNIITAVCIFTAFSTSAFSQTISLTGPAYSQNFDLLSNTAGSTTNNFAIAGWFLLENGGGARDNEQYAVDVGASNTGDTYSYGAAASTERALGSLRSGTLISTYGAAFTNNSGSALTGFTIAYTGEQWRLGTAARTDLLDFQYSLDATSLSTGTWIDVNALDFITPVTTTTGAKDGNAAVNQTALSATITGLTIAEGQTFFIRWVDADATSADDGLAIDDFSITPQLAVLPVVLSSFNAVKAGNAVKLSWKSEQEINMHAYELQRQPAGSNQWQTIDSVAAAGNAKNYIAYDLHPVAGNNLYRLKMINSNRSFAYSDVATVKFQAQYQLTVYPSPATNNLYIKAVGQAFSKAAISIQNVSGQTIIEKSVLFNGQSGIVDVSTLKAGIYIITIVDEDLTKTNLRFVKE